MSFASQLALDMSFANYADFCQKLATLYTQYLKLGFSGASSSASGGRFEPELVNINGKYVFNFLDACKNQHSIAIDSLQGADKLNAVINKHTKDGKVDAQTAAAIWALPEIQLILDSKIKQSLVSSLQADKIFESEIYPQINARLVELNAGTASGATGGITDGTYDLSHLFSLPVDFKRQSALNLSEELARVNQMGVDAYLAQPVGTWSDFEQVYSAASISGSLQLAGLYAESLNPQNANGGNLQSAVQSTLLTTNYKIEAQQFDRNFPAGSFEDFCSRVAEKQARNALEGYLGGTTTASHAKVGFEPQLKLQSGQYHFLFKDSAGHAYDIDLGKEFGANKIRTLIEAHSLASGEIDPKIAFAIWKLPHIQQKVHDQVYQEIFNATSNSAGFRANVFDKIGNQPVDVLFKIPVGYQKPGALDLKAELQELNTSGVDAFKQKIKPQTAHDQGYEFFDPLVGTDLRVSLSVLMGDIKIKDFDVVQLTRDEGLVIGKAQSGSSTGQLTIAVAAAPVAQTPQAQAALEFYDQLSTNSNLNSLQQAALNQVIANYNVSTTTSSPVASQAPGASVSGAINSNVVSVPTPAPSTNYTVDSKTGAMIATAALQQPLPSGSSSVPAALLGNAGGAATLPTTNSSEQELLRQFADAYYEIYCDRLAETMAKNALKGYLNHSDAHKGQNSYFEPTWNGNGFDFVDSAGGQHRIDLSALIGSNKVARINDYLASGRSVANDPKVGGYTYDLKTLISIWELPEVQKIVYNEVYSSVFSAATNSGFFRQNAFTIIGHGDPAVIFAPPNDFQPPEHQDVKGVVNQLLSMSDSQFQSIRIVETIYFTDPKTGVLMVDPKTGVSMTQTKMHLNIQDCPVDFNGTSRDADDTDSGARRLHLQDIFNPGEMRNAGMIGYSAEKGLYTADQNLDRYYDNGLFEKLVIGVIIGIATMGIGTAIGEAVGLAAAGTAEAGFGTAIAQGAINATVSSALSSAILGTEFSLENIAIGGLTAGVSSYYSSSVAGFLVKDLGFNATMASYVSNLAFSAGSSYIQNGDWSAEDWFVSQVASFAGRQVDSSMDVNRTSSTVATLGTISGQILAGILRNELNKPENQVNTSAPGTDPALKNLNLGGTAAPGTPAPSTVSSNPTPAVGAVAQAVDPKTGMNLAPVPQYDPKTGALLASAQVQAALIATAQITLPSVQVLPAVVAPVAQATVTEMPPVLVQPIVVPTSSVASVDPKSGVGVQASSSAGAVDPKTGISLEVLAAQAAAEAEKAAQQAANQARIAAEQAALEAAAQAEQLRNVRNGQIAQLYLEVLFRAATTQDLETYRTAMEQGYQLEEVRQVLLASDERFIHDVIQKYDERKANANDFSQWMPGLISKQYNREQVEQAVQNSPEAIALNEAKHAAAFQQAPLVAHLQGYDPKVGNYDLWTKNGAQFSPTAIEIEEYNRYLQVKGSNTPTAPIQAVVLDPKTGAGQPVVQFDPKTGANLSALAAQQTADQAAAQQTADQAAAQQAADQAAQQAADQAAAQQAADQAAAQQAAAQIDPKTGAVIPKQIIYDPKTGAPMASLDLQQLLFPVDLSTGNAVAYQSQDYQVWNPVTSQWDTFQKLVPQGGSHAPSEALSQVAALNSINLDQFAAEMQIKSSGKEPLPSDVAHQVASLDDLSEHHRQLQLGGTELPSLEEGALPILPGHKGDSGDGGFGQTA